MSNSFPTEQLDQLAKAEEVEIETQKDGQSPVHRTIIWVVTIGEDVYVRSVRGVTARWYREISANPTGALYLGGQRIPIHAELATDAETVARVGEAYQRKYSTSPAMPSMLREETLVTTLRLTPLEA